MFVVSITVVHHWVGVIVLGLSRIIHAAWLYLHYRPLKNWCELIAVSLSNTIRLLMTVSAVATSLLMLLILKWMMMLLCYHHKTLPQQRTIWRIYPSPVPRKRRLMHLRKAIFTLRWESSSTFHHTFPWIRWWPTFAFELSLHVSSDTANA